MRVQVFTWFVQLEIVECHGQIQLCEEGIILSVHQFLVDKGGNGFLGHWHLVMNVQSRDIGQVILVCS